MADKKSSEDNVLYQCIECQRHRVIRNGQDGNTCNYCDGYLKAIGFTNLPTSNEGKKIIHHGGITITADVSDALKGLKAVQREARKATQALKELEVQQGVMGIKNAEHPLSINEVRRLLGIEPKGASQNFKCIQCGENELTLKSLGVNIKGVKLVCEDCGEGQ